MRCDDAEREGREAARFGRRYDYEHEERMRNAAWDRDSCDAAYADGYQREIDRREAEREEEERQLEAEQRRQREAYYEDRERWEEQNEYGDAEG